MPDHEKKKDGPEVGDAAHEIRVRDEPQHARSHQKADEDLSDHGGLVDPGGKEIPGQGDEEQQAHLELDEVQYPVHVSPPRSPPFLPRVPAWRISPHSGPTAQGSFDGAFWPRR